MMNKAKDYENNNKSLSLMEVLLESGIIGTISITDDGKLNLELFLNQEELLLSELEEIEEKFTSLAEVMIGCINRLNSK